MNLDSIAKLPLFKNSPLDWAIALAAVVVYAVLLAARQILRGYLRRLEKGGKRRERGQRARAASPA